MVSNGVPSLLAHILRYSHILLLERLAHVSRDHFVYALGFNNLCLYVDTWYLDDILAWLTTSQLERSN